MKIYKSYSSSAGAASSSPSAVAATSAPAASLLELVAEASLVGSLYDCLGGLVSFYWSWRLLSAYTTHCVWFNSLTHKHKN